MTLVQKEVKAIKIWTTNVKKVTVWRNGTEKQVRPSGWGWWQPWANTLLYLPLENDFVDQSWQATTRTFTTSGLSYTTVWWVPSVHIGSYWWAKLTTPYPIQSDREKPLTVSLLVYVTTQSSSSRRLILDMAATNWSWLWMALYENTSNVRVNFNNWDTTQASINWAIPSANSRFNIVATATAQSSNLYINWQLVWTWNWCQYPRWFRPYSHDNTQWIFCTRDVNRYSQALNWNARELIMEQIEWTAQEVASYYSQIKAKLWI